MNLKAFLLRGGAMSYPMILFWDSENFDRIPLLFTMAPYTLHNSKPFLGVLALFCE